MKDALAQQLYDDFPELYRGVSKSKYETAMCWGIECGDGWYPVIRQLSKQLVVYQKLHPAMDLEMTQVKSKYGALRIHLRGGDEITAQIIADACSYAERIPE